MVKQSEYLVSVNEFKEPKKLEGQSARGLLILRLILMDPGTDQLHPTMGVGIRKYRYGVKNMDELRKSIDYQIRTFLPDFQTVDVTLIQTPDKLLNIEITADDVVYVYDSKTAPIPIKLDDIRNN